MSEIVFASYSDGQIVPMTREQYNECKGYYNLHEVGSMSTKISCEEFKKRILYPTSIPDIWEKEYRYKFED